MLDTPTAYDENLISDHFWQPEAFDEWIPPKGFVSDFVLFTRGIPAIPSTPVS